MVVVVRPYPGTSTAVQRYLLEVGEYVLNLDLNCRSGVCLGWVQPYEYRFTKFSTGRPEQLHLDH